MRVGVLTGGSMEELDWAHRLGFRSIEWMRLQHGPSGPQHADWKLFAERFAGEAKARDLRISAIGALYQNPLDPKQTEFARAVFRRAIEVAAHIGVKTVAGFAGAVIETELDERGGHVVYKPFENYLPQVLEFWEPLAKVAADQGRHDPVFRDHEPSEGAPLGGQRLEDAGLMIAKRTLECYLAPVAPE